MATEEKLREAFKFANAIIALEGWIPSPEVLAIQERVICGELTYDQGVREQIKAAHLRHAGLAG